MRCHSMMTAWWGNTGIGAMGIEQGFCVVFDFDKEKVLAVLTNKDQSMADLYGSSTQIRIVAFSSRFPILIFAESTAYIHVVDMLTWKQQILPPPKYSSTPFSHYNTIVS